MNVLVIDDEPTTRALLKRALMREFGCTVIEAADGYAGLQAMMERPFGIVITDLRMPVLSGLDVLEAIRSYPQLAPTPVVIMSVERNEETVRKAIQLGISGYLTKPLDARRVVGRLAPIFKHAEADTGTPAATTTNENALAASAKFMVADGSADFRHFFASTFAIDRPVLEAASGIAAFADALAQRPAVMFIGGDLGLLGADLLARKLRAHPVLAGCKLVSVRSKHDGTTPPNVDATIVRSFVPELVRDQVDKLFGPPPPSGGVLIAQPSLRLQAASACEQVFGMMLGMDVEASLSDAPPVPKGAIAASQMIEWTAGNERLLFTIMLDVPAATRVAAGMLGLPAEALDDELIESAAGEVSNVVTGRLKTAFEASGTEVQCSLPEIRRMEDGWTAPGARNSVFVGCLSPTRDLTCVMTLAAVTRAPAPAGVGSAAELDTASPAEALAGA